MNNITVILSCVEADLACIIVLVILAVKASSVGFDRPIKNKLFEWALWFAVGANAADMVWSLHEFGVFNLGRIGGWLDNVIYFMCLELTAFVWFIYAETVECRDILHDRRRFLLCGIPVWVLAALLVLSAFNGWIFYVDASGVYHRGPLFPLQVVLSYGYAVYTLVKSLQVVLLRKNAASRREYIVIASFAMPLLLCGLVQYFLPQVQLAAIGVAISYMLVYLNSLQLMATLDPVTGIIDRRQFLLALHAKADALRPGEKLYFLFLDVDNFKAVNDTFGHDEGDHVLHIIADVLREVCMACSASFGRYGGDEFAVAYVTKEPDGAYRLREQLEHTLKQRLRQENAPEDVRLSIGIVEWTQEGESIQDLITRADREMYLEKERKAQAEV